MDWTVTIKIEGNEKTYSVKNCGVYEAKKTALELFLKEFNIPGRSYSYIVSKRFLSNIKVVEDPEYARASNPINSRDILLDKVDRLREDLRLSLIEEETIEKASRHLFKARELISG